MSVAENYQSDAALLGGKIQSIDFAKVVGAPLQAICKCQFMANMHVFEFLKKYCFIQDPAAAAMENASALTGGASNIGQPKFLRFTMNKPAPGIGNKTHKVMMSIPLFTLINLPAIQIEEVELSFMVKLTSQKTQKIDEMFSETKGQGVSLGIPIIIGAHSSVSKTSSRQSSEGLTVTSEYSMNINIKMRGEDNPPGMQKVIEMLENLFEDENKEDQEGT
mmetsp:Transcript_8031/g.20255  ORF Transcript_8031/g.20255 Transcript_8031/m.20255 type:complete len:220 (+) Transcript_8031:57-716(+)|eukprot:CAMPEP_0177633706 /NCGR_PEP_ID=MMETSP0447-20121125/2981_1 /TAXON_ID=0 /ORGANISM="Stygamoeba regulata, Strain BSH-02190019" /LENGTH=219 /DNA_ID=CAMNT_0019135385 /DNA_START=6 /DNA_END=665 /DNA_ORIENTATION=-